MGIDVDRIIGATFVLGGALGGVASVVYALYNNTIYFQMGYRAGMDAFTAAVLGGIGNIPGAMLGGLVIGVIRAMSDQYIATEWTKRGGVHHPYPSAHLPAVRVARDRRAGEGLMSGGVRWSRVLYTKTHWFLLAFALFLPALDLALPRDYQFSDLMRPIFIFATLGLGLNIVTGYTGLLNLGVAAFMAIGAYSYAILTCRHLPLPGGVLARTAAEPVHWRRRRLGPGLAPRYGCAATTSRL